jgi:copper oxidase (laccase) domain-containing protein
MIEKYHCNPQDIYLYIGSHIHKENYIYDTYPTKLDNKEIWKDAIKEVDGKYQIDMEQAIKNQLEDFRLAEIKSSPIDTSTEEGYASHYKAVKGDISKKGQNIVGFYYKKTQ